MNTIHFYWDYGTFVEEITDPYVCSVIVGCFMVNDTEPEHGIGEVFLSPASNNFFVTPC
jgi:hypothetical protein